MSTNHTIKGHVFDFHGCPYVELWGYCMLGMCDVRDVGCSGCGMFGMWDVGDVGCSGCSECGMFGMWDVQDMGCSGCGMLGMWDVDLQNTIKKWIFSITISLVFYKMQFRQVLTGL